MLNKTKAKENVDDSNLNNEVLPTYKDQVREQQRVTLLSNRHSEGNSRAMIIPGLSSGTRLKEEQSPWLDAKCSNDTIDKKRLVVAENNNEMKYVVEPNDYELTEHDYNTANHLKTTTTMEMEASDQYLTDNDDYNTFSSITESEYIVEAIPVQSMILVTAQIVDNDDGAGMRQIIEETTTMVQTNRSPNERIVTNFDQIISTKQSDGTTPTRDPFLKVSDRINYKSILAAILVAVVLVGSSYLINDRNCIGRHCSTNNNDNLPNPEFRTPTIYGRKQFTSRKELLKAVEDYMYLSNLDQLLTTYGSIEYWDVSGVQDFQFLFSTVYRGTTFTADISRWDVSSANDTSFMFMGAQKFNSDLSRWDVSKVSRFTSMFNGAAKFTSNLSRWDVSSAIDMDAMFSGAKSFNSDLSRWDLSSVQTMNSMFAEAEAFNGDLSKWNVSSVFDMSNMFAFATNFTSDLSKWDIRCVTSLSGFVQKTDLFDSDLSKWDTSSVQLFDQMFSYAESFRGIGVERWDVSNGTTFDSMFSGTTLFDRNLSQWQLSNATSMIGMFMETKLFRGIGLENWNVTKVTTTHSMFQRSQAFDCNLSQWDLSNDVDMISMFASAIAFQGIGLNTWQHHPTYVDVTAIFCNAIALNKSYISEWSFLSNDSYNCLED